MIPQQEAEFSIHGDVMQFVEIELDPQESVVAEAGSMLCMDSSIEMKPMFGDGSSEDRGFSLLEAGKLLMCGESLFLAHFLNRGPDRKKAAFGAPYPGRVVPVHLGQEGGELIAQKDSFLCATQGASVGIAFIKRLKAGFFGEEGFIMQRLKGDGWVFLHAGGAIHERTLQEGEILKADIGCVAAFQSSVAFDIEHVGRIKSALFPGEGLILATLAGPGKAWIQSLPLSRLAGRIQKSLPEKS